MQTATLRSAELPGEQGALEALGLAGTTLMQLWAIGVANTSDLTAHTTETLRKRLAESLNGSAASHARIEKALRDIHDSLRKRHLELKAAAKAAEPPAPKRERPRTEPEEGSDNESELAWLDKANLAVPRFEKDVLFQFYQDMRQYKLLSKGEQFELGRRVIEEQDMVARDTLVLHNLRLVLWMARKYLWATIPRRQECSGLTFADLVQEGMVGLMIAAEKFDYRLGFTFSTYAQWWIRQAITRSIMDSGFVRIPVHMGELLLKVRRAMNEIALREKRPPTLGEIAAAVEEDPKKVKQALRVARLEVSSLQETVGTDHFGSDSDTEQLELIADETALRADHILEAREELNAACSRLNDLTETLYEDESIANRNKEIFVRFYGLDGSLQRRTLEHVSERYDITRERVRQLIATCWDKLQLRGCDKDHESVVEELARIQELEKLANRRVSAS